MKRISLVAVLLVASLASAQQGQVPYIETLDVRVHNLDVIVTDKQGKPITDLRQEDFEIFEDGVAKAITNFSAFTATAVEPEESTPEGSRKFIFYVDEMSLIQSSQDRLRKEFDKLLVDTMRPGDQGLVLRPEVAKVNVGFTADREALRAQLKAAIDAQKWRAITPTYYEERLFHLDASNGANRRITARRWADLVRRRVQQRLGNLKSAVTAAAELPGRKVMVFITESMPAQPGRERFYGFNVGQEWDARDDSKPAFATWAAEPVENRFGWADLTPLVEEIGRIAASGGITIYPLQPESGHSPTIPGDFTRSPQPAINTASQMPMAIPYGPLFHDRLRNTELTLSTLANITGGKWYRGWVKMDDAARQIASDVQSYYSLGYRAGDAVDEAHRVEVRVKNRPDLRVRARREVVRKSPEREMTDRVVAALIGAPTTNELQVKLEVTRASAEILVPMSALTFLPAGDVYRAQFTVHYAASGNRLDFVSGMQGPQTVEVPAADFENAKSKYWRFIVPLNIRSKGEHEVAIGVLDSYSRLSGIGRSKVIVR